jgi:hypothetical protein
MAMKALVSADRPVVRIWHPDDPKQYVELQFENQQAADNAVEHLNRALKQASEWNSGKMNKQPGRQTENPAGGASGVFGSACGGCGHHPPGHSPNNQAVISFQKVFLKQVMTGCALARRRWHIRYAVTAAMTTQTRQPRNPPQTHVSSR